MGHFSRTVAEAWVTLQVAHRNDVEIRIDYKTAQLEGESCGTAISTSRAAFPDHYDGDFSSCLHRTAKRGALDALDDAMEG